MAYELHLERTSREPITLAEWRAAVEATPNVRMAEVTFRSITNPKTGEVITMGSREGDAEVFLPDIKKWRPVFRWRKDSATFALPFDPAEQPTHALWLAATALASHLGGAICGDEGESYDPATGSIIRR